MINKIVLLCRSKCCQHQQSFTTSLTWEIYLVYGKACWIFKALNVKMRLPWWVYGNMNVPELLLIGQYNVNRTNLFAGSVISKYTSPFNVLLLDFYASFKEAMRFCQDLIFFVLFLWNFPKTYSFIFPSANQKNCFYYQTYKKANPGHHCWSVFKTCFIVI